MTVATLETGWLADTPVGDTVVRRYLHNQAAAQEALAAATGGRVAAADGVVLSDLGAPVALVNQAVLLRPLTGLDDPALDAAEAFYRGGAGGVLLSAWPTPALAARGWELVGHPTFVVRGPGPVPPAAAPGVSVRAARDAAGLAEAEDVAVRGYPLPPVAPHALLGREAGPVVVRLGLLDGVAVATAASHVSHGLVNLCLAATLPAARRRGVWRALVAARLADAPDLPAAAITSDDSRPGFERMGFLPVTRMTLWLRPASPVLPDRT